jgi:hypothetical protein
MHVFVAIVEMRRIREKASQTFLESGCRQIRITYSPGHNHPNRVFQPASGRYFCTLRL